MSFKLLVKLEKLNDIFVAARSEFSGKWESLLMSLLETQGGEYALFDNIADFTPTKVEAMVQKKRLMI